MVSIHLKDIKAALGMLSAIYGDSSRMMRAKKAKLVALGKLPKPGSKVASHFALQIDWYLQMEVLIEGLQKLAHGPGDDRHVDGRHQKEDEDVPQVHQGQEV